MRNKKIWYRLFVGLCGIAILATAVFSPSYMASASYVSDHINNAQELEKIRMLYEAASRCMGSSRRRIFTLNLSARDSGQNSSVKNAYNLNNGMFESVTGDGSNLVYSATLESMSGGYKDGKIWCSEYNLLPELLALIGQYTVDVRDKLICNNSEPGLFRIESGYFTPSGYLDVRPEGVPAQDDCSGNFALLVDYIENRPSEKIDAYHVDSTGMSYPFYIRLTPSSNAAARFQTVVSPLVGRFDEIGSDTRKAMEYWRYYQAFESGCGVRISNGSTQVPAATSTNMNAIYDAVGDGKIVYFADDDIHADRKVYYGVNHSTQLTCKELAGKLGSNISDRALALQGANIQNCIDTYKSNLDDAEETLREYRWQQRTAKGLKNSLTQRAGEIRSGRFEATVYEDEYGEESTSYFDLNSYANSTLNSYYDSLNQGIDGKPIYNSSLVSTIISAFRDIANNTTVNADRVTIDSKPEEVTFNEFNTLLSQLQDEIDRVEGEINAAQNLLDQKRTLANGTANSVRGEIWEFDESALRLTCMDSDIQEEFAEILAEAPPTFNASWSGAVISSPDGSNNNPEGNTPTCFSDGSALGWILCPALEIMSNAVNGMYDTVANQWLEVGANEMEANNSNGVYVGWKTFRDAANVIFVIFLIIVIFSQVTGFGLTNYGVKKTLPTLIMIAVLVNLSFILCQLAVDATNILGDGLRAMFEGMQVGTGTGVGVSDIVTGIASGILQLAVVGGGIGLAVHFSGASLGMLLVPLLLALISALIGTVVFFLSLAIRKAGIFAMIVLCPVAVICYALPNTKKFFDRWLKLFTALLMVYPICGILMGGGKFFSSILLTSGSNSFFMALTAMLIQVVPFFFIPTLVKSSLNMMGNLGTKLSNLGSRFTRGAQGALSRSRWAQERQQRLARDANVRRDTRLANKWQQRLSKLEAKGKPKTKIGQAIRNRSQNRAVYEASRAADRFRRSATEDARAAVEARRGLPTQGSMQYMNMLDAYENAARDREINEWQASMLNGNMSYESGGNKYDIDVNNLGKINAKGELEDTPDSEKSLSAALKHYLDSYDNATDKNSETAKSDLLKAQAIATRLLEAGGDNGQTIVTNALRGRTFDANGHAKNRDDIQSVSRLSEYIARNGKWMGQIKKTDVGSFSFLNDTANKTAAIKDRAFYHTTGDKKITAAAIPGLSDGFFEGIVHEIGKDTYDDANSDEASRLLEIDAAASRAMADERIANEIKPETRDWLNKIHKKAYEIQQQRWLNGSTNGVANISQLKGYDSTGAEVSATGVDGEYLVRQRSDGSLERLMSAATGGVQLKADDVYQQNVRRYRELVAGQSQEEVKILRKRSMPSNIEIDPAKNIYRMKLGDGSYRDLTPDEQRVVDKIIDYNASVDLQNQGD